MNRRTIVALVLSSVLLAATATAATKPYHLKKLDMSRKGWWHVTATYPSFTANNPIAKAATVGFRADAEKAMKQFIKDYGSDPKPEREYEFEIAPVLSIATPQIISGYLQVYANTWGAHPGHDFRAHTYGIIKGKSTRLRMRDILKPGADLADFAEGVVLPELNVLKKERGGENVDSLDLPLLNNFVVTPGGITIIFPAYSVGCYAEGDYYVKLPWSKLKAHIDPSGPLAKMVK